MKYMYNKTISALIFYFFFLSGVGSGRLFEAGRLLTFPTCRVGAYSRWALIRGWALKVAQNSFLIFFNTNSLRDRCYHTVSFVSMKIISNKCPFNVQQVFIIFMP